MDSIWLDPLCSFPVILGAALSLTRALLSLQTLRRFPKHTQRVITLHSCKEGTVIDITVSLFV